MPTAAVDIITYTITGDWCKKTSGTHAFKKRTINVLMFMYSDI